MTYLNSEFQGIKSILSADWTLRIETPLCIRNGGKSAFNPSGQSDSKIRNADMSFKWNADKTGNNVEVSESVFEIKIENGEPVPYYTVPSSSIRGAFRSWTIRHLVKEENRKILNVIEEEDSASFEMLREAVKGDNGLKLVKDIFGLPAGDTASADNLSRRGMIKVETDPLLNSSRSPWVQGNDWKSDSCEFGPSNAFRHITVRGPVDRITNAPKEGGLHYFLELSPGQTFTVMIRITNPRPAHCGLLALWEREINTGFLRIGGLQSIGRGRLNIEKTCYQLSAIPKHYIEWPTETLSDTTELSKDVFAGILKNFQITDHEPYMTFLKSLLN